MTSLAGSKEIRALNMSRVERTHPINEAYHQEVSELIRTVTGAREVLPQPSGLIVRYDRPRTAQLPSARHFIFIGDFRCKSGFSPEDR